MNIQFSFYLHLHSFHAQGTTNNCLPSQGTIGMFYILYDCGDQRDWSQKGFVTDFGCLQPFPDITVPPWLAIAVQQLCAHLIRATSLEFWQKPLNPLDFELKPSTTEGSLCEHHFSSLRPILVTLSLEERKKILHYGDTGAVLPNPIYEFSHKQA